MDGDDATLKRRSRARVAHVVAAVDTGIVHRGALAIFDALGVLGTKTTTLAALTREIVVREAEKILAGK